MKKWIAIISTSLLLLAGCGETKQNEEQEEAAVPEIIAADLAVPEKAEVGEEVTLAVTVTQGEEAVEDANEVKFEIWMEGAKDSSELVVANHTENGKYEAAYTFLENGVFNVQSHVTARDMHTMPTKKLQVGKVEAEHEGHAEGSGAEHHHDGDVSIHLQKPEHVRANEKTDLAVHVQDHNEPLLKAEVRLEIFQKGQNPAWIKMTEGTNGEYKTDYSFPASGDYIVRIHVENDEGLHEHTEVEVTVE